MARIVSGRRVLQPSGKIKAKHADIVGTVTEGGQELGSSHRESWMKNNNAEKRGVVQAEIPQMKELRKARATDMGSQCTVYNREEAEIGRDLANDIYI